jgi:hypothetical protein
MSTLFDPEQSEKKQASSAHKTANVREMLHVTDVMLLLGVSAHSARESLVDIAGARASRRYRGVSTGVTVKTFCDYFKLDAADVRSRLPARPYTVKEVVAILAQRG